MESRNARFLKRSLQEENRRMTPAERVRAFIEHSKTLMKIRDAGEARRKRPAGNKPATG